MPLTFFVEIDISNAKNYAKAMLPFMNAFYALEDIKKKTVKYYLKLEEQKQPSPLQSDQPFLQEDPLDE